VSVQSRSGQKNVAYAEDFDVFRRRIQREFGLGENGFHVLKANQTKPVSADQWKEFISREDLRDIKIRPIPGDGTYAKSIENDVRNDGSVVCFKDGEEFIRFPCSSEGGALPRALRINLSRATYGWKHYVRTRKARTPTKITLPNVESKEFEDCKEWFEVVFKPLADYKTVLVPVDLRSGEEEQNVSNQVFGSKKEKRSSTISYVGLDYENNNGFTTPLLEIFVPNPRLERSHFWEMVKQEFLRPLLNTKIRVVFDLDHTLISCHPAVPYFENKRKEFKENFKIDHNGKPFLVFERPGLKKLLTNIEKIAEITVVSTGAPDYVDRVCREIQKRHNVEFKKVSSIHHTIGKESPCGTKDIRRIFFHFNMPGHELTEDDSKQLVKGLVIVDDLDVWTGIDLTSVFLRITPFDLEKGTGRAPELERLLSSVQTYHEDFFEKFSSQSTSSSSRRERLREIMGQCHVFKEPC